jgi:hypothetical protein
LSRLWEAIPPIGRPYAAVIQPTYHRPVAKETGETAHVERHNTLRQRLGRLVRKSLSWSKATEMLVACLALFFHRYNQEHAVILPLRVTTLHHFATLLPPTPGTPVL